MKSKFFTPTILFLVLIAGCISSACAQGPDGFANVAWGASKSQLDQIVAQQGFRFLGQGNSNDGSTAYRYYGTLAGTAGNFEFSFLSGVFFRGHFSFSNEDGGAAENRAYWQFLPLIQSKYGASTETSNASFPYSGGTAIWYGQAPGSSDKTQIVLSNSSTTERCGRGYCTSNFDIIYINQSLQQRLAGQRKDGL